MTPGQSFNALAADDAMMAATMTRCTKRISTLLDSAIVLIGGVDELVAMSDAVDACYEQIQVRERLQTALLSARRQSASCSLAPISRKP